MSMIFDILAVLAVVSGGIMCFFEKTRHEGKALISVGIGILGVMGIFMVLLLTAFGGASGWVVFASVALTVMATAAVICAVWGQIKKKKVWISLLSCGLVCAAVIGGFNIYEGWKNSIPTVGESDDLLWEYRPYGDGTKVVTLDEQSDLQFGEGDYLPRMDGATALYPIYSAFARAVYPKISIDRSYDSAVLKCCTTTGAYERIVTGESDIIFVAGPSDEQLKFAEDNGVELVFTPIGREAFVFFVNSQNPMDNITLEQVRGIYSGEIKKWSELGVSGLGSIRAFQRDEGSGSQSALERLMAGRELMTAPREDIIDGMGGIITKTADYRNYKNAIGYSFRFYSTEMAGNEQIKLLSINGTAPTRENIENGTYPIASEFFAVTRSDADENTLRLLEWIQGEQGQYLVEATGYTPLT